MMETWVLIPPELCLVPTVVGGLGGPSARVWTRVAVAQGRRWSPFQGTVRLGVMPSADAGVAPANGLNASPSLPVESDVSPSSRYLVFVSSLRIKYQKSVRAWGFSWVVQVSSDIAVRDCLIFNVWVISEVTQMLPSFHFHFFGYDLHPTYLTSPLRQNEAI